MIPLHDDNPTHLFPFCTVVFIAICVLVFIWQTGLAAEAARAAVLAYGVIPAVLLDKASLPQELYAIPSELTVFSSMFLHGGFMHLVGNMLYLWIFGNNVEDAMGHVRFVIFYFLCGVAAVAGQVLQNPQSEIPMIGASGAISGVLGAYLLLYPKARVLAVIPLGFYMQLIRLPAGLVLGFWFLMQIVSSLMSNSDVGVAWFAHIGGFIAGVLLIPLFKQDSVEFFHGHHGSRRWQKKIKLRKH